MGKLSILGAQRVKALQEVLDELKKAALREVPLASSEEVLDEVRRRYPEFDAAYALVKKIYGQDCIRTYWNSDGLYRQIEDRLNAGKNAVRADIEERYRQLGRELWLCETLEEAKAIVYGSGDVAETK